MDIIKFFFQLSTTLKLYHWKTSVYSRHISSGTLYDQVILATDTFMETYFGRYGKGDISSVKSACPLLNDNDIVEFLRECVSYLNDIVKNGYISQNDTDLINMRDDLIGNINKTLYLFTFN